MLATALSIHLLKTGEGLLHACISSILIFKDRDYVETCLLTSLFAVNHELQQANVYPFLFGITLNQIMVYTNTSLKHAGIANYR